MAEFDAVYEKPYGKAVNCSGIKETAWKKKYEVNETVY